jgi:FdhD protein
MAHHFDGETLHRRPEELVVEEPLTVRINEVDVATTMRTPGHDFELAVGLLHADGALGGAPVVDIRYCATGTAVETEFNVVSVLAPGAPEATPRLGVISSSCGLCGTEAIEELVDRISLVEQAESISEDVLLSVVDAVAGHQPVFDRTGGLHAAASFEPDGTIVEVREDIGRHNAVDKVVGRMLLDGDLPATGRGLFVSGRASFEMVQKAWAAGFTTVIAVSAPSALAVAAATSAGMQLAGFARNGTLNVYATNRQPDESVTHPVAEGEPVS